MATVLLIEDDIQLAGHLIRFLTGEQFEVVHAAGQAEGLRKFAAQRFDCALIDVSLPDGNGFAVCAEIRRQSELPVIFLTASADEACTVAGFEVGADDYISKPFRPRELIARMKNAMRRSHGGSTILECGSVQLDTARGIVTKQQQEIMLSALEYRLLLVFFSNRDKLLTRDRLMEELWSVSGEYIQDNTLNVYIRRLREKIEDDPRNPAILRTVRGLGYKAVSS